MRKLDRINRIPRQKRGDPGDEIVDVGYMRQHIGRGNQGRGFLDRSNLSGQRLAEIIDQRAHTPFLCRRRHIA